MPDVHVHDNPDDDNFRPAPSTTRKDHALPPKTDTRSPASNNDNGRWSMPSGRGCLPWLLALLLLLLLLGSSATWWWWPDIRLRFNDRSARLEQIRTGDLGILPTATATPAREKVVATATPQLKAAPASGGEGAVNPVNPVDLGNWDVDQSAPNMVYFYGCEVVAGIQPDYGVGQCIWHVDNPSAANARNIWVPGAYVANAGTDGTLEYGPCTFAGGHGQVSFTLPHGVTLTPDKSKWNWTPPSCHLDTTKEWDENGNPVRH